MVQKKMLKFLFIIISFGVFSIFTMDNKFQAGSVTNFKKFYGSKISLYGVKDLLPLRRALFFLKPSKMEENIKSELLDSIDSRFAKILSLNKKDIKSILDKLMEDRAYRDKVVTVKVLKEIIEDMLKSKGEKEVLKPAKTVKPVAPEKLVEKPVKSVKLDEDIEFISQFAKFQEIEGEFKSRNDLKLEDLTQMAVEVRDLNRLYNGDKAKLIKDIGDSIKKLFYKR